MSSEQPQTTYKMTERRTEHTVPDQDKINLSQTIYSNMSSVSSQIKAAKSRLQQLHNMMNSVTSGSVLNIHATGNSSYNQAKSGVERGSTSAKQAASAASNAKTTKRILKIEKIRQTYSDGRLVGEEVVNVECIKLD